MSSQSSKPSGSVCIVDILRLGVLACGLCDCLHEQGMVVSSLLRVGHGGKVMRWRWDEKGGRWLYSSSRPVVFGCSAERMCSCSGGGLRQT